MNPTDHGELRSQEEFELQMLELKREMLAQLEELENESALRHHIEDNTITEG